MSFSSCSLWLSLRTSLKELGWGLKYYMSLFTEGRTFVVKRVDCRLRVLSLGWSPPYLSILSYWLNLAYPLLLIDSYYLPISLEFSKAFPLRPNLFKWDCLISGESGSICWKHGAYYLCEPLIVWSILQRDSDALESEDPEEEEDSGNRCLMIEFWWFTRWFALMGPLIWCN